MRESSSHLEVEVDDEVVPKVIFGTWSLSPHSSVSDPSSQAPNSLL